MKRNEGIKKKPNTKWIATEKKILRSVFFCVFSLNNISNSVFASQQLRRKQFHSVRLSFLSLVSFNIPSGCLSSNGAVVLVAHVVSLSVYPLYVSWLFLLPVIEFSRSSFSLFIMHTLWIWMCVCVFFFPLSLWFFSRPLDHPFWLRAYGK